MTTNNYSRWSTLLVTLVKIKFRLVPYLSKLLLKYGFLGQKSQSSLEIGFWEKEFWNIGKRVAYESVFSLEKGSSLDIASSSNRKLDCTTQQRKWECIFTSDKQSRRHNNWMRGKYVGPNLVFLQPIFLSRCMSASVTDGRIEIDKQTDGQTQ